VDKNSFHATIHYLETSEIRDTCESSTVSSTCMRSKANANIYHCIMSVFMHNATKHELKNRIMIYCFTVFTV